MTLNRGELLFHYMIRVRFSTHSDFRTNATIRKLKDLRLSDVVGCHPASLECESRPPLHVDAKRSGPAIRNTV